MNTPKQRLKHFKLKLEQLKEQHKKAHKLVVENVNTDMFKEFCSSCNEIASEMHFTRIKIRNLELGHSELGERTYGKDIHIHDFTGGR